MNRHLLKFDTTSSYEAAESGLLLPNVSLITEVNEVKYKPYVDPYAGHDYVEIGGLKWATMNVGAESPSDYGLLFQWGDSSGYTVAQVGSGDGKKYFGWEDYKYGDGSRNPGMNGMTKYNYTDGKKVLDAEDDGVAVNWGGKWRMPTSGEIQTLGDAVNTAWTNDYNSTGVSGMVFTAKDGSGAELFFPAAGVCSDGSMSGVGSLGFYWSSSLRPNYFDKAHCFSFNGWSVQWQDNNVRHIGRPLRGVAE